MSIPASVTLHDGSRVALRPIRPSDASALRAMFHRLSAESRYQRFFAVFNDLSPAMLSYLTDVDGDHHIALIAVVPDAGGERIVGVARAVRDADQRDVAEAALTVADDMQRRGLGTRLLAELSHVARARGVRRFRLEVKRDNAAMRRLVAEADGAMVGATGADITFEVELRRSPARILLHLIASQTRAFFALLAPPDAHV
ncbi:Acetyl-CoA synthetase (ADP-forming) protein [Minicystis rosea]|nr:Acetyl-CoA synthetase (ADP-forming) protein [Minicystis rosea]